MDKLKTFDSREDADAALETVRLDHPIEFCPLIPGRCKKECVCYVRPYIRQWDNKFRVEDGYCSNGMFQDRPDLQI